MEDAGVSRRALLLGGVVALGGLGAVALATGQLPGVGDDLPAGVPSDEPGTLVSGSFTSAKRSGVRVGWSISYPPGHDNAPLPVLIALHGRTGHHGDAFGASLHLDRFQARAARHGVAPFAIAAPDGGDHEYWHPRAATDPAGMVVDEFLPLLAARGLDVRRIGLIGWSMGGYGALYLAGRLGARRVAVAVAESPAIWHHAAQTVAGAFDDAADFDEHTVFGRAASFRGVALRIDCGDRDGFAPTTRDLRAELTPTPAGGIGPGGHDSVYWRSQAATQLAFVGAHLAG